MAVDAESDAQFVVERFDVDVGGAVAQRLADDAVDQLDDGRLVVEVDLARSGGDSLLLVEVLDRLHEPIDVGVGAVHRVDEGAHRGGVGKHVLDRTAGCAVDLGAAPRRRVDTQHHQRCAVLGDGDGEVATHHCFVEHALEVVGNDDALGLGGRHAGHLRHGHRGDVPFGAEAADDEVDEREQVAIGLRQAERQVLCGEVAAVDE